MVKIKILLSKLHSKNLQITMLTATLLQNSNLVCLLHQIVLMSKYLIIFQYMANCKHVKLVPEILL